MNCIRRVVITLLLGFALAGNSFPQENKDEETYPVRIILEPRPDAKFYQVEWLENNDIKEQQEAPAQLSRRDKITRTEIKTNLPVRFRYFRLRSAYRDGLYGPWGEIVEIQRPVKSAAKEPVKQPDEPPAAKGAKPVRPQEVFAQVIDKDGRARWVLRGKSVAADKLDQNNPLFYDVEAIGNKEAPENTNGRKKYEGPVTFENAGQYKMNLYNTEDTAVTEPIQTWIFWVYTDIPRTYAKFYAPFLHGKGGFTVGAKTKIALIPEFGHAPNDKMEYRIYAEGSQPGAWNKYLDEIEVASFAKGKYGFYIVEFQATNVAGVVEPMQTRRMLIDARAPAVEEGSGEGGVKTLILKDENFPIVVRIYQNGKLVEDKYFKQWRANDVIKLPAGSVEVHIIDLLGNEVVIKK